VISGAPSTIQGELPDDLQAPVAERAGETARENVAQRVWGHDQSLWGGPGVPEIENRLGWLTVSDAMLEQAPELLAFAEEVRAEGFTDAVLLGMGGSSLGPEVLRRSFGDSPEGLRLQVLDSTHPDVIKAVQESVDLEKTLFIVSSKSGGTVETLSHYRYFKSLAKPNQFVVVTDPGSPLEQIAKDDGLRRTFLNTPDIGGRYSVLSYFGLVPAALMGVDVEALLHSAQEAERNCREESPESNAALWLGAAIGEMARHGRDKLTFFVSGQIESFGLWAEQLVAESTGKHGRGILPVADEPLGEPGVYGPDRVFAYLRNADEPDEQLDAAVEQLASAGQPTLTLATHGPVDLGRIFFLSEFAVAVAGWALEINPFDQPDVQEAKDKSKEVLAAGSIPAIEPASDDALRALLADASPPHYVAILAYLAYSEELDAAIAELRTTIRGATGAAVTFGYGPRFQHSTGQEHKGGAPNGRFLQLTDDPRAEIEIPGESYSFGTLTAAEAAGDLQTLRDHGLLAERVKLDGDPAEAVRTLTTRIAGLLE
jgi:glucose-6-phosphate isomerase